ncbi:MAG: carboxypeptidase regulatory-like domain-containing protein [Caldilineaceae bacterium]
MLAKQFNQLRPNFIGIALAWLMLSGCVRGAVINNPASLRDNAGAMTCTPTHDDGVSPTYKPNAPVRASVGHGHVLTGVVRSSRDCAPIANARLELWPEYAGRGHPDDMRATVLTDSVGRYRFECNPPEHIHIRISAPGYRPIGQNSYHPNGQAEGKFDIVLAPEPSS